MCAYRFTAFQEERKYINESLPSKNEGSNLPSPPWKEILTSLPVHSLIFMQIVNNYGIYTIMNMVPTYLNNIQHVSISSVRIQPHNKRCILLVYDHISFLYVEWYSICSTSSRPVASFHSCWHLCRLFDKEQYSFYLKFSVSSSITFTSMCLKCFVWANNYVLRKLFTFIGHIGPCLGLVGLSFVGCNQVAAITVLTMSVGLAGCVYSGYVVSPPGQIYFLQYFQDLNAVFFPESLVVRHGFVTQLRWISDGSY